MSSGCSPVHTVSNQESESFKIKVFSIWNPRQVFKHKFSLLCFLIKTHENWHKSINLYFDMMTNYLVELCGGGLYYCSVHMIHVHGSVCTCFTAYNSFCY